MNARRSAFLAAVLAALLVQASLQGWFALSHSATFDEPGFIAAGVELWTTGYDRREFIHPPLAKRIQGLAALAAGADPARAGDDLVGTDWLYRTNRDRAGIILLAARLTTIAASLALTAAVASWAWNWWGPAAGALAGWLMAIEPNSLAHGALATIDVWLTLWIVLFSTAAWRLLAGEPGRWLRARCGLFAGLALATKYSAVAFLPAITAAFALAVAVSGRTMDPFRRLGRGLPRALAVAVVVFLLVALGQLRCFEPDWGKGGLLSWWPLVAAPLGGRFMLTGFHWVLRLTGEGVPAFFLGSIRRGAVPAYFPVAFGIKVALGLILLAGISAAVHLARRRPDVRVLGLVLAIIAIFASVAGSKLHLGLRHVQPAVVFTALLAAGSIASGVRSPRLRLWLAAACWLWCAASMGRCAPHFLAHFNEIAGGPGGGWRYLADSNLDWGQDLPGLAKWCRERGVTRIPIFYFGTADPEWYGVAVDPKGPETKGWKGGLVAISVSYLDGTLTWDLDRFGWARSLTPVARPGWSINVYDVGTDDWKALRSRAAGGAAESGRPPSAGR